MIKILALRARTPRTSERSLSCVCSHVCLQVGLISKGFTTIFVRTTEGFLSRVNEKVTFEFGSLVETFVTTGIVTHKLFLSVSQKMLTKNLAIVHHFRATRMKTTKSSHTSNGIDFSGMRSPFVLSGVSTIKP